MCFHVAMAEEGGWNLTGEAGLNTMSGVIACELNLVFCSRSSRISIIDYSFFQIFSSLV